MFLSRFGVKNYKCLGEIDIPLTPIHVLIGENDAGKTSLLEAMTAFHKSAQENLPRIFPEPWDGQELVRHGSRAPSLELAGAWETSAEDEQNAEQSGFRYGFAVDFPSNGMDCRTDGDWIEHDGEREALYAEKNVQSTFVRRWEQGQVRPLGPLPCLDTLRNVLKSPQLCRFNSAVLAAPAAFDPKRRFRLEPDGLGLATLLDDILGFDPEVFIRLRKQFCELFPEFRSLRVITEMAIDRQYHRSGLPTSSLKDGKGIYLETHSGKAVRAQQASDGAVLFLGFLALAHLPDPPRLLLIEEPENGIYPKRLVQVIRLLKRLVEQEDGARFPQIIMSTHSPYVLSFFEPEEVTFLSRPADDPDGPVRARPLRDAPNIRERMGGEFYLGELWYNLSEKELFGDA